MFQDQRLSASGIDAYNLSLKILLFVFIIFADKKLHWFDQVKREDIGTN